MRGLGVLKSNPKVLFVFVLRSFDCIIADAEEVAGAWHGRLQKDMAEQKSNIRALQKELRLSWE
eukprot:2811956-Amphidinium_carterae.1